MNYRDCRVCFINNEEEKFIINLTEEDEEEIAHSPQINFQQKEEVLPLDARKGWEIPRSTTYLGYYWNVDEELYLPMSSWKHIELKEGEFLPHSPQRSKSLASLYETRSSGPSSRDLTLEDIGTNQRSEYEVTRPANYRLGD